MRFLGAETLTGPLHITDTIFACVLPCYSPDFVPDQWDSFYQRWRHFMEKKHTSKSSGLTLSYSTATLSKANSGSTRERGVWTAP